MERDDHVTHYFMFTIFIHLASKYSYRCYSSNDARISWCKYKCKSLENEYKDLFSLYFSFEIETDLRYVVCLLLLDPSAHFDISINSSLLEGFNFFDLWTRTHTHTNTNRKVHLGISLFMLSFNYFIIYDIKQDIYIISRFCSVIPYKNL